MSQTTYFARNYQPDTFVYNVDIVGTCNLGCVSCPVGNMTGQGIDRGPQAKGFMSYGVFAAILDKILSESPVAKPAIALYNWGEPMLHPEIGRIIRLVRRHGLYCAVSTNLNQARFLEQAVIAGPSSIKISLSGFTQGVYGRTHTKGRIETVKLNMRLLRELVDRHDRDIDIVVGYHDYLGNDGDEVAQMEALARELRFDIRHKIARLSPLEKLIPLCQPGTEPEPADRPVYDLLLVKPEEWSQIAREYNSRGCIMREQEMSINYDGSVALCCNVFDYANNIAPDFLGTSHADLQARKNAHTFCASCSAVGYPTSCGLDGHPAIQEIIALRRAQPVMSGTESFIPLHADDRC